MWLDGRPSAAELFVYIGMQWCAIVDAAIHSSAVVVSNMCELAVWLVGGKGEEGTEEDKHRSLRNT